MRVKVKTAQPLATFTNNGETVTGEGVLTMDKRVAIAIKQGRLIVLAEVEEAPEDAEPVKESKKKTQTKKNKTKIEEE